ncbi:MAG: Mov34/MPN/PAD-1 family protein [Promethearchaeota archaeon]
MASTECIFHKDVLDQIKEKYNLEQWSSESGGMLIGWRDDTSTYVTAVFFPPQQEETGFFCKFSGRELARCRTALIEATPLPELYTLNIVGWVHTHPRLKTFMSTTDHDTFSDWTKMDQSAVAVVIDPYLSHPSDIDSFTTIQEINKGETMKIQTVVKTEFNLPIDVIEYLQSFQEILISKYENNHDTVLVGIPRNEKIKLKSRFVSAFRNVLRKIK